MTANMLGGVPGVCGTVSSGGTESILLAMKVYRDRASSRGITEPEMIVPSTAHAAFDKASEYFGITKIMVPVGERRAGRRRRDRGRDHREHRGDRRVGAVLPERARRSHRASSPRWPRRATSASTPTRASAASCCRGRRSSATPVPPFDFRVPGVTSMSADTHKYGYAAKGTSVVLYRDAELRHFQYYTTADWSGGLYFSPTFAGSRPGALSAACWAAMLSIGESGLPRRGRAHPRGRDRGEGRHRRDRRHRGDRRPLVERGVHVARRRLRHLPGARRDGSARLESERLAAPRRRSTSA